MRPARSPPTASRSISRPPPRPASCPISMRSSDDLLARTVAFYLASPSNPQGAVADAALSARARRAGAPLRLHGVRRRVLFGDLLARIRRPACWKPPAPTSPTWSSSTRCRSARACPACASASSPATRISAALSRPARRRRAAGSDPRAGGRRHRLWRRGPCRGEPRALPRQVRSRRPDHRRPLRLPAPGRRLLPLARRLGGVQRRGGDRAPVARRRRARAARQLRGARPAPTAATPATAISASPSCRTATPPPRRCTASSPCSIRHGKYSTMAATLAAASTVSGIALGRAARHRAPAAARARRPRRCWRRRPRCGVALATWSVQDPSLTPRHQGAGRATCSALPGAIVADLLMQLLGLAVDRAAAAGRGLGLAADDATGRSARTAARWRSGSSGAARRRALPPACRATGAGRCRPGSAACSATRCCAVPGMMLGAPLTRCASRLVIAGSSSAAGAWPRCSSHSVSAGAPAGAASASSRRAEKPTPSDGRGWRLTAGWRTPSSRRARVCASAGSAWWPAARRDRRVSSRGGPSRRGDADRAAAPDVVRRSVAPVDAGMAAADSAPRIRPGGRSRQASAGAALAARAARQEAEAGATAAAKREPAATTNFRRSTCWRRRSRSTAPR